MRNDLVIGAFWNVNKVCSSRPKRIVEFNSIRFANRIGKIYILCSTTIDVPLIFMNGQPSFNLRPYIQIYRKAIIFQYKNIRKRFLLSDL